MKRCNSCRPRLRAKRCPPLVKPAIRQRLKHIPQTTSMIRTTVALIASLPLYQPRPSRPHRPHRPRRFLLGRHRLALAFCESLLFNGQPSGLSMVSNQQLHRQIERSAGKWQDKLREERRQVRLRRLLGDALIIALPTCAVRTPKRVFQNNWVCRPFRFILSAILFSKTKSQKAETVTDVYPALHGVRRFLPDQPFLPCHTQAR